jgi:hypothetical protein
LAAIIWTTVGEIETAPQAAFGVELIPGERLNRLDTPAEDEVATLDADLALDVLLGFDQADDTQVLPVFTNGFVHPGDVNNKRCPACFQAAVILLGRDRLLSIDTAIVQGLGGGEEITHGRRRNLSGSGTQSIVWDQHIHNRLDDNLWALGS